ncbi:MAG: cysteine desulfurase [Firmicutes bacterium HGW-Firmicutes-19]|jgi:cysteine desulfurase|nr:MAG: cysteine desulfurase [Firmicutes bacterium HGW-Firmicutes-19]
MPAVQSIPDIYFDYASTAPIHHEVIEATHTLLPQFYANPDSLHTLGYQVGDLMRISREKIASLLHVMPQMVIFTGSATEANNMAIKGAAFKNQHKGKHCITTKIEHSSVLNTFKQLQEYFGFEVDYLDVDAFGVLSYDQLKQSLRKDTILVSIMAINNEIGTIADIEQIKKIVKSSSSAILHVDFVQMLGKYPIDLNRIDLATFSAHKIGGLKGSGLLIRNTQVELMPLISGGQQEYSLRGGTSNTLANITFAKALRIALEKMVSEFSRIKEINDYLRSELTLIPQLDILTPQSGSAYILAFSYPSIPSEIMMNALSQRKIYVSAHSTCTSQSAYSHVHLAIGLKEHAANGVIRLSFGDQTTMNQAHRFIEVFKEIVKNGY